VVNRPGNARATRMRPVDRPGDRALDPHAERICVRGDTDFSLTATSTAGPSGSTSSSAWTATTLRGRAEALPEAAGSGWSVAPKYPLTDQTARAPGEREGRDRPGAWLCQPRAELRGRGRVRYQPGKCTRPYRVVALRKNISKMKGEQVLFDEIRYFFYITTRTDLSAAEVVQCANERCDQENVIEQLKNGVGALRVPLYDLSATGPTWSSPRWRGTSSRGSR
jgi:hypothetical protein